MVDGMPVQTAWVDVRSIGSGGGSVAYIDQGGLMRVGPRSAGADPGPAAYGRGGTEPAMTDAATVLGMLGPGELASGIRLDVGKAEAAVATVASALGKDVTDDRDRHPPHRCRVDGQRHARGDGGAGPRPARHGAGRRSAAPGR